MTTQEKINQIDQSIYELRESYGYTRACNKLFDILETYVENGTITRETKLDIIFKLVNKQDAE